MYTINYKSTPRQINRAIRNRNIQYARYLKSLRKFGAISQFEAKSECDLLWNNCLCDDVLHKGNEYCEGFVCYPKQ